MTAHGGNLDQWQASFPEAEQPWLDLSTGICPWPYPIDPAMLASHMHALPTANLHDQCVASMASAFDCHAANILPVPGTEMVIRLLPHLLQSNLIVSPPTYGDYADAWQACDQQVIAASDLMAAAEVTQPGFTTVLCNPNNPDGRVFRKAEVDALFQRVSGSENCLVVDEAYGELLMGDSMANLAGIPNLVVLRSLGKFYGLPGLRLGAVLAGAEFLDRLKQRLGHWSVSSLALASGAVVYGDVAWRSDNRARLKQSVDRMLEELTALNIEVGGHTDLFFTLIASNAPLLWRRLMSSGIYTRCFDGAPELLRIGIPVDSESEQRLLAALRLHY